MLDIFLDFFFPKTCVGCGTDGIFLCKECRDKLDFADQICPICCEKSSMGWVHDGCRTIQGMDGLIVIYEYQEETTRKIIDGIKFQFNKDLVDLVLENFKFESGEDFDLLVPVPLYFYRENWRGFNQAELIAQKIGKYMNLPASKVLGRLRMTKQQSLMKTKEERSKNIQGAFGVTKKWRGRLKNKKVLLIDDVFTSGADMRECTKILKRAGAKIVWGLALAH